ncbi:CLUMA_CG011540, isoform A [Clunio marinus]|uniref:CLUMA_CG011540, isoform A n=1 Tax=Clunio marinus TaxID=568069 RepID=A0A1J1IGK0_9DIPT|nr:CLUMA_CG011540, isoform A [Clunio marinus]
MCSLLNSNYFFKKKSTKLLKLMSFESFRRAMFYDLIYVIYLTSLTFPKQSSSQMQTSLAWESYTKSHICTWKI